MIPRGDDALNYKGPKQSNSWVQPCKAEGAQAFDAYWYPETKYIQLPRGFLHFESDSHFDVFFRPVPNLEEIQTCF